MDVNYLKEEERARLQAFTGLFESAGWAALLDNVKEQITALEKQMEYAKDIGELRYIVGSLDTLRGLRDYEKIILASFESAIESRREGELEIDVSYGSQE